MNSIDFNFWPGKKILVTGHTGFKGSWLSLWLQRLGAEVVGFSTRPPTAVNLFELATVADKMESVEGDVRDFESLASVFRSVRPEIVFHLAAQSIVSRSFTDPVGTYATNVMGTVNVLEAARITDSTRVIVNVTSDKCYQNFEDGRSYGESDRMGGKDPYSNSKGCAELVSAAYQQSFFNGGSKRLLSARAGNVIGGGDWAVSRLIPDCIRAFISGEPVVLRNPQSVRPWQHVLEPLAGYLFLAQALWAGQKFGVNGINFGPPKEDLRPVSYVVGDLIQHWGQSASFQVKPDCSSREAVHLALDSSLATAELNWRPRLRISEAIALTAQWYRAWHEGTSAASLCSTQIEDYQSRLVGNGVL